MGLILLLRNISPPAQHKFYVLEMALLSFQLEVAVDSDIKGIEESVMNFRHFQILKKSLTTMGQPFPNHQEDFFQDEG